MIGSLHWHIYVKKFVLFTKKENWLVGCSARGYTYTIFTEVKYLGPIFDKIGIEKQFKVTF